MLEKAIFRKHTNLFLYMASRQFFSQKELIKIALENKEFKDKDSIENKGQFLDKLILLKIINKYKYKDFLEKYPSKIKNASLFYVKSHERKRVILEFNQNAFLALDFPALKKWKMNNLELPFIEYVQNIYNNQKNKLLYGKATIQEIVNSFISGCSLVKIYFSKYEKAISLLKKIKPEVTKKSLPYVKIAQAKMEEKLKSSIII